MKPEPQGGTSSRGRLVPLLVFALAAVVFSRYGFQGNLTRDDSVYMYGGQRAAQGVPPYVGIFDIKGPFSQLLPGLGVITALRVGWDDLLVARLLFFVFGCLTVVAVYLLGSSLFQSRWAGFYSALTFLGFAHFGRRAASGPSAKTPMVLFETLCLLWTSEQRWFLAGLSGALSALIWQPAAVFPVSAVVVAATLPRPERTSAILRALGGIALPVAATIAYFAAHDALPDFLDGGVLFIFRYLDRTYASIFSPLQNALRSIAAGYFTAQVQIAIGFIMAAYFYLWRLPLYQPRWRGMLRDRFAPLLLTFPIGLGWSLFDYAGGGDLYWFLPFIAVGFGLFVDTVVRMLARWSQRLLGPSSAQLLSAGAAAGLVVVAVVTAYLARDRELGNQRTAAVELETKFGRDVRLLAVNVPQVLVLLHRENPTRYVLIGNGIERRIDATTPGGFDGWIQSLEAYRPDVVVISRSPPGRLYTEVLMRWLGSAYREEPGGPWRLFVRAKDLGQP